MTGRGWVRRVVSGAILGLALLTGGNAIAENNELRIFNW
jgi:putrescine transport system substrate-binding protein